MAKQLTYKKLGDVLDITIAGGCSVGDLIDLTNAVGVALQTVASGAVSPVAVKGVFDGVAGVTGVAWSVGAKLYWDDTNNQLTSTVTSMTVAGIALSAHVSTAVNTCTIWLNH